MTTRPRNGRTAGHISLAFGAALTGASAVAVDLLAAERPIHTLGLGVLVATIALLGQYTAPRFRGPVMLLNAGVVAQPALHLAGKWVAGGGTAPAWGETSPAHPPVPEGVSAGQLALTVLIVTAILVVGRLAEVLTSAVRSRVRRVVPAGCRRLDDRVDLPRVNRRGTMLHWCGWTLRAARRGPPGAALRPA